MTETSHMENYEEDTSIYTQSSNTFAKISTLNLIVRFQLFPEKATPLKRFTSYNNLLATQNRQPC